MVDDDDDHDLSSALDIESVHKHKKQKQRILKIIGLLFYMVSDLVFGLLVLRSVESSFPLNIIMIAVVMRNITFL